MLALTDTVQFLNKVTGRTYDELEKTSLIEPSKLLDSDYLTKINKKLEKKYSYLIVKSEGELIFNGGIDNDDILRKLPRISNKQSSSDVSSYMDSDDKVLIKQLNFRDSDGDEASLYIVTSTACVIPEVRTVLIEGAFALVLILITTAAMLIVWIYRSIITPIERCVLPLKISRMAIWTLSLRRVRATERLVSCVLRLSRCVPASRKMPRKR